jgi:hypothetical protein
VECIEKNNHVKFDKLQQKYLKQKIEAIRDDGQTFNVHKVFDFLFNSQTIKGDEKEDIITIID